MEFKKACTPSSWPRTILCPGWVATWKQQGFPKGGTSAIAERGTRIHEIARMLLEGYELSTNNYAKDELEEAENYVAFVRNAEQQFLKNRKLVMEFTERKVMIPTGRDVHTGMLDRGIMAENPDGSLSVLCIDLKTGHSPVDPDTAQGIAYQRGMIDAVLGKDCEEGFKLKEKDIKDIFFFIYQQGEAKRSKLTSEEFEERYDSICGSLSEAKDMFDGTIEAELITGDHCRYCPALGGCPAHRATFEAVDQIRETALSVLSPTEKPEAFSNTKVKAKVDLAKQATAKALNILTIEEKVKIFRLSAPFVKFLEAVKNDLTRIAKDGEGKGHVKLVKGPGRRTIVKAVEFITAVEAKGKSPYQEPELITLTEADKILGKEEMKKYVKETEGGLSLALADDPRPEANELAFGAIEVEFTSEENQSDSGL